MVFLACTVWRGEEKEQKGRFILNFHKQIKNWTTGGLKVDTSSSFAVKMERCYIMY